MTFYMYQASYTAKSMAAQLKDPQDPVEAIKPALEELGAKIVVAGFPFGEYDVLVVYEAPDDMTAASVAMAVAAAGEVKSGKTTRLLSGQEWLESLRKRRIVSMQKARSPHDRQHESPEVLPSGRAACGDEFQDASRRQVLFVDPYAEGRECVLNGVHDRGRRDDHAAFAHATEIDVGVERHRLEVLDLDAGNVAGGRHQVIHERG